MRHTCVCLIFFGTTSRDPSCSDLSGTVFSSGQLVSVRAENGDDVVTRLHRCVRCEMSCVCTSFRSQQDISQRASCFVIRLPCREVSFHPVVTLDGAIGPRTTRSSQQCCVQDKRLHSMVFESDEFEYPNTYVCRLVLVGFRLFIGRAACPLNCLIGVCRLY